MLRVIFSSIRFLSRQGLALRGRFKAGENSEKRAEFDLNLIQLLRTRGEDDPAILQWLQRSQDKFTRPEIQNEILSIMVLRSIRDISSEFSGQWYTLMVDESTDLSNTEQMVVCLRGVIEDLEVHEEVLGLYSLESTNADTIVSTIKDVLLRMNLKLCDCRGQCYDGASSMSGSRSGVATKILAEESKVLYTQLWPCTEFGYSELSQRN